jgi:hypothetical protein
MPAPNPSRYHKAGELFKPQFSYPTPEGFRDEVFLVPFQFNVLGDGKLVRQLPWQLDDDVPYIIRGIIFPQIGLSNNSPAPGFARIWDTQGNPLSLGLVLALGMWSQAGLDWAGNGYAWGFPIEPEVECSPGGALLFDFQLQTNATIASVTWTGILESILFQAGVYGTAGNAFTVAMMNPAAPNVPLSVVVNLGVNVVITLATDGASALISTVQEVVDLVNSSPALVGIMSAQAIGTDPNEVIS